MRITARSFPVPDVVKTTNNPALWDQLEGFATVQAQAANEALALLDERLATATTFDERVAAFEAAYRHVADWRYEAAADGWTRADANLEDFRTPIGSRDAAYPISPGEAGPEPGSPAHRTLTDLGSVALGRFGESERTVQNHVDLRDGRTVDGNRLMRASPALRRVLGSEQVTAVTATEADRETLRRAAFETLAALETRRAETGGLDPAGDEHRGAYADAAYFMTQGPEFPRGSDAVARTFLVAAHARVFEVAAVLPPSVDLDGMVRGQDGFHEVMRDQLRLVPPDAPPQPTDLGERTGGTHLDATRGRTGPER